ncbi:class C sortase [Sporosarcina pasteurii]|uniref:Sortase (Surface protein transpeptidase) n=1 Tax=Sporosarcina pasteurii TaxID=1474 RepID=A0A380BD25_SPOPA|nr:class C sortase [Sporosarcina pasteurii]MDS9472629.1 class C sortase [Sporosarcina pasteurii]QBQ06173.1 class C sortase [Sporosarcina pasteurii]SUI99265.1 Sortase (surface protein transpeptidase) [Sporosarcina pasteurii]
MKKNSTILIVFLLGAAILLYPHVAQFINSQKQKKQVETFLGDFRHLEVSNEKVKVDGIIEEANRCNEELYDASSEFYDPFLDDEGKLKHLQQCLELPEGDMFAAIEIPKLKLVIPLYLGATQEILNKGVGQVEGSSIPVGGQNTHTVLAGHRGMGTKAMFRDIDQLFSGDVFYVHTMKETLTYKVYKQKVIYPYETDSLEIEQGKDLATLLTCHPYRHNYQRLLIQGERIE